MAAAALHAPFQASVVSRRRRPCWTGTPEIYFTKAIDNSRLVKVEDPRRTREMRQFGIALSCLFLFVMAYAFQHFKAIEYGYKIEAVKSQREGLVEMNRALRLEEASLRDPERIDRMARELGLQSPQAGQVVEMDTAPPEGSAPEVARLTPVSVVSER
jgi:cell division protein FtsL